MVEHPAEYPWSSYHANALDKDIELITPHSLYVQLSKNNKERKAQYQTLFKHHIPDLSLKEIREATNKAWVLGSEGFKQQIETQTGRRASPLQRGGDRKSKVYRDGKENQ